VFFSRFILFNLLQPMLCIFPRNQTKHQNHSNTANPNPCSVFFLETKQNIKTIQTQQTHFVWFLWIKHSKPMLCIFPRNQTKHQNHLNTTNPFCLVSVNKTQQTHALFLIPVDLPARFLWFFPNHFQFHSWSPHSPCMLFR